MPRLEHLQEFIATQHKVQLFEGKDGLKTLFNDYASKPDQTVKIIGFMSKWLDAFGIWTEIYYRKKKENKIQTLALVDESERTVIRDKRITNSTFRFLKNLDIDAELFIYQDKIALVSFEPNNLKGVIIQDKEIHKLQSLIFDIMWKEARP
jgi:hypothetical protein